MRISRLCTLNFHKIVLILMLLPAAAGFNQKGVSRNTYEYVIFAVAFATVYFQPFRGTLAKLSRMGLTRHI